jgi:hypothetical protein
MKLFRWVTAGAGAIAVAGFGGAAFAWPTSSYTSDMMPYNRAQCLGRAARAMAAEGWVARPSGGPGGQVGLLGHKEPSSAYILCLEASNAALPPGAGTTVVVFVTSTASNPTVAAEAVSKLQQWMLQPGAGH